jgi:hypothetical protein
MHHYAWRECLRDVIHLADTLEVGIAVYFRVITDIHVRFLTDKHLRYLRNM